MTCHFRVRTCCQLSGPSFSDTAKLRRHDVCFQEQCRNFQFLSTPEVQREFVCFSLEHLQQIQHGLDQIVSCVSCKYNTSCTWNSRTFYDTQRLRNIVHNLKHTFTYIETTVTNCMNDTTHTDEFTKQHWARCAPFFWCVALTCSHHYIGSRALQCFFHFIHGHGHAHLFLSVVFFLFFQLLSSSLSSTSSWILPWCLTRIPWKIPVQLRHREHGHLWLCHTRHRLWAQGHGACRYQWAEPRDFQRYLLPERPRGYIVSLPNPDIDDNELAKFLAVVVDRTGQPVEVRSNSDHFSCSVRNVKSAQSQFPLVTQSKRVIDRTEGLVEERIGEERESSNAQNRTLLNEQRRTIVAEYV